MFLFLFHFPPLSFAFRQSAFRFDSFWEKQRKIANETSQFSGKMLRLFICLLPECQRRSPSIACCKPQPINFQVIYIYTHHMYLYENIQFNSKIKSVLLRATRSGGKLRWDLFAVTETLGCSCRQTKRYPGKTRSHAKLLAFIDPLSSLIFIIAKSAIENDLSFS